MSDLIELDSQDTRNAMREEIRKTSDHNRARRVVISRVMVGLCSVAIIIAAVPLVMLMYQLIKQGASQVDWKFFTTLPTTPTLVDPTGTGGISNAIVGTLALTLYASIMAIPMGIIVGIYLAETQSKLATTLRVIAQTMAGAPSILMGLFAFSFIVHDLTVGFSAIAGAFALAVLMMPVIIISTEIAVRNVPATLREAGLALGARSHVVSLRIVLPSALTGIVTGAARDRGRIHQFVEAALTCLGDAARYLREREVRVAGPARPGVGNRISPGRVRFHSESQRPHLGIKKAAG
jgi:phosphate transport system permease protein